MHVYVSQANFNTKQRFEIVNLQSLHINVFSMKYPFFVLKRLGLVNFVRPTWSCIRTIHEV